MIKQRLNDDVKTAMLSGDKLRLETLRGLKSAILYAEVAAGKRDEGLTDIEIEALFAKEAKKRQESADIYKKGGAADKADKELTEKAIIEEYLPEQMSEDEIAALVEKTIAELGVSGSQAMGQVIGKVKQIAGSTADGGLIAKITKEQLS